MYVDLLGIEPEQVGAGAAGSGRCPEFNAEPFMLGQQGGGAPRATTEPVPTVTGDGYVTVVRPFLIGQHTNNTPKGVDEEPVPAVTTIARIRLIEPVLAQYNGRGETKPVHVPIPTISTRDRFALVDPLAVPYGPSTEARSTQQPLPTVMTKDRLALATSVAEPFVVSRHGNALVRGVDEPVPTATTSGAGDIVEPTFMIPYRGERDGQAPRRHSIDAPMPTVTTERGLALAGAVLVDTGPDDLASAHEQTVEDPLGDAAGTNRTLLIEPVLRAIESGSVDPRRVVLIDGQPYLLDIRFRMLKNRELARAMGFDDDESQYEFVGTQSQVTKQIGNAVCVNLAAALVRAILDNPTVATTAAAA
jgi:DNA (cytosine-5)-methyltransferase 1